MRNEKQLAVVFLFFFSSRLLAVSLLPLASVLEELSLLVTRVVLQTALALCVLAVSLGCSADMVLGVSSSPGFHFTFCVSKERRIWQGALRRSGFFLLFCLSPTESGQF